MPPRSATSSRLVLGAGLASAAALAAAAALDFGDPAAAARDRARRAASAEAEIVRRRFEALLEAPEPPAPPLGPILRAEGDLPPRFEWPAPPAAEDAPVEAFDAWLDVALAHAAAGGVARALLTVDDALARSPGARRAPEGHLACLAWAGELGMPEAADRHRSALLALDGSVHREGVAYRLLAALAGPADAAALASVHEDAAGKQLALPPPDDRVAIGARGIALAGDPVWAALRKSCETRASDLDWALAFHEPERLRAAAFEAFAPRGPLAGGTWTVAPHGELLVCARVGDDATELAVVSRAGLAASLERSTSVEPPLRLEVRAAASGRDDGGELAGGALPGTGLDFAIVHDDLPRVLRAERRRIGLLRAGLAGLAALVAFAAYSSWRSETRTRRLADLRSTFIASVSHDLRTPLASILLMAENLESGRVSTELARERYYAAIRRESERLRRMVEDLLDASRIERGSGPRVARRDVDAAAFLDELERAMLEAALAAGARLSLERGAVPATLHIDADAVRRAVWNLFENALRHGATPGGAAEVSVRVAVERDLLEITVADRGRGVPQKYRETIFEPFERMVGRAGRGALADDTGTGLGLSIVRAIARAHGGDVTLVGGGPEPGARFRFAVSIEPGGASPDSGPGSPGRGRRSPDPGPGEVA